MTLDWDGISPKCPSAIRCRWKLTSTSSACIRCTGSRHHRHDQRQRTPARMAHCARPDPDRIAARQALVMELVPRPLFRDKLLLQARLAARSRRKMVGRYAAKWLENNPATGSLRPWLLLLSALSIANIILFSLYLAGIAASWWLVTFYRMWL